MSCMGPVAADRRLDVGSLDDALDEPLELRAQALSRRHSGDDARTILQAAIGRHFPGRVALVSSFGAESASLLHLAATVDPSLPVLFLDTGKHFAQTTAYRRDLAARLGLTDVRDLRPEADALAEADPRGDLWAGDPDGCCTLRKVRPLAEALSGFDAWITGRKQFHGAGRLRLPVFEAAAPHIKINPIVGWGPGDLAAYAERWGLPAHPLVEQGYPSIGCWPCTHPSYDASDPRAGRWRGSAKTECGIHQRAGADAAAARRAL